LQFRATPWERDVQCLAFVYVITNYYYLQSVVLRRLWHRCFCPTIQYNVSELSGALGNPACSLVRR
ncbi:hypothetical protein CSKR_203538, partial [Clonorchis sinensis]